MWIRSVQYLVTINVYDKDYVGPVVQNNGIVGNVHNETLNFKSFVAKSSGSI